MMMAQLSGQLGWRPRLDSRLIDAGLMDKRPVPGRLIERGLQHPEMLMTHDPAESLRDRVTGWPSHRFGEGDWISPSTSAAVSFRTVRSSIPRKWRRPSTEPGNPILPSGPLLVARIVPSGSVIAYGDAVSLALGELLDDLGGVLVQAVHHLDDHVW